MTEVVTFTNPVELRSFETSEEPPFWRIDPSDQDDFRYFDKEDWKLEVTFTKIFNPKIGDKVKFGSRSFCMEVRGRDGDELWLKHETGRYTTCVSQVEPWSE